MLIHFRYCLLLILLTLSMSNAVAYQMQPISIELNQVDLSEAIRMVAKMLRVNVIVSPSVSGRVTLRLHNVLPEEALRVLLSSYGLTKWERGQLWVIAKPTELVQRQEEEVKWHTVLEETEPLSAQLWQLNYGNSQTIARILTDERSSLLSKRGRIRADQRTNTIYIEDIAERLPSIHRLVAQLDIPVQQIAIEARLASVDSDVERELGLRFVTTSPSNDARHPETGMPSAGSGAYTFALLKLADSSWLDVKLSALEKAGQAELISSPSLFTANQETASIEAGEEIPYQETSESGGTAVVFKKAVLGLKVTPQVLPNNRLLLQLQINQDRPSNKLVQGVPTISTRQIITSVLANSGQTVVLGGIYEVNQETGQEGIPFLSQIPLLGRLFSQHNMRRNKRELLIFVTPRIMT